ncbi:MAG: divergent PAP2 family protein [Oscillospiraceae bacterium]|nr:divergent PAP2 family protein [Oscillospiraceae bacterium]
MSEFIRENYNEVLVPPIVSFIVAQLLKYVIYALQFKVFRKERLTGAGGMPSSHSSGVCTLMVVMAYAEGLSSPLFAVSVILGLIVMYDAAGVRRAAGKHAQEINKLLRHKAGESKLEKDLKEFLGHTPLEVICGAILGIAIGFMFALWNY